MKHRSTKTMSDFVEDLQTDTEHRRWFWQVQDFAEVADRWGGSLPPSRVHVVTVPPAGARPGTLWTRFATLVGLDPDSFDTEVSRVNTSLGMEQTELLRRVNAELGDRLPLPGPYPTVVKNVLAHRILAARPGTRLALDAATTEFAVRRSREIADRLAAMRVDVVGDLAELVPDPTPSPAPSPGTPYDSPPDDVLLEESIAALAGTLEALAHHRGAKQRYEETLRELKEAPVRFALVQASERRPLLMKARRVYQRRPRLTRRPDQPAQP